MMASDFFNRLHKVRLLQMGTCPPRASLFVDDYFTQYFLFAFGVYDLNDYLCIRKAPVAELVDALDLGSSCFGSAGSSPVGRTTAKAKLLFINSLAFSFAQNSP